MIYPKENWLTDDVSAIQMPWYTRACLEVINTWDFKEATVFEYGIGYSTLWYHSRGAICYGVESDKKWYDFVTHKTMYCGFRFTTDKFEYIRQPINGRQWLDIIIIDGLYRDDCTEYALKALKPGGKLILDNWLQPEVEEFWPKTQKLIEGMPIEIYKEPEHPHWQTAIVTV